ELELVPERAQVFAGRGRKEVSDSVDHLEAAFGAFGGIEAEQRDDSVDIEEQERLIHKRSVKPAHASPAGRYGVSQAAGSSSGRFWSSVYVRPDCVASAPVATSQR